MPLRIACPQADLGITPLKVVGYEGLLGSATMLLVLLPLAQRLHGVEGLSDFLSTKHVYWENPPQGAAQATGH